MTYRRQAVKPPPAMIDRFGGCLVGGIDDSDANGEALLI